MEDIVENHRDQLLERISRTIDMLQKVQADSRTPIQSALDIVDSIRKLTECRRALRAKAFEIAAEQPDYARATSKLREIADTVATDLGAFEQHAELVAQAAQAADAVVRVTTAVGALLA
jgi:hypothetical protein